MKKVLKIVGIVAGALVILIAIIFTAVGISLNNLNEGKSDDIMTDESFSVPDSVGMPADGAIFSNPLGSSKSSRMSAMETQEIDTTIPAQMDKKIIKNGNLSINVERIESAQEKISEIAKNNGGSVFSSNINRSKNNLKSGYITAKVPVNNFEKAFSEFKEVAVLVLRESTSGQDVTEQYQDLETRIKNKKAEEEAYKKILESAQKTSDVIEITEALSRVRMEIESYELQLKNLASQTDMSTITINITEDQDVTVVDSWRPWQIAKDAVNSLIKMTQGFITFLIVFIISIIPVAILYLIVVYVIFVIVRKIYRKFRKNKDGNNSAVS